MRSLFCFLQILLIGAIVCSSASGTEVRKEAGEQALINRIDGIVWDPNRKPAADIYVELQNEMFMSLGRVRTTGSGRFSFTVANPGNYVIKVLTSGTNFQEASQS